jgi:hypothetical protein
MLQIERSVDMRLVLDPAFIVLDIECIEDGDVIMLKNLNEIIEIQKSFH